jgi:hypothetical protein
MKKLLILAAAAMLAVPAVGTFAKTATASKKAPVTLSAPPAKPHHATTPAKGSTKLSHKKTTAKKHKKTSHVALSSKKKTA